MTTKNTRKPAGKRTAVAKFPDPTDREKADAIAKFATRPSVNAAAVVEAFGAPTYGELDMGALTDRLLDRIEQMKAGDMSEAEGMLLGQAHALQSIFVNLSRRTVKQEYLKQWETYMRMALKAQNQCRMTLETLSTLKNPPVVFAKQANINNGGQQQVNNGTGPIERRNARARETETEQTELLEAPHGQRLDTRAPGTAGGADPHMEAVGTIDRPANQ
ncbi:hypothetical protein [Methyloversatilis sp.]|uniref:hypothetical protein n=1 Tax=Methyloversatilis sp. TaxID=2569862 RepID=UPI003F6FDF27